MFMERTLATPASATEPVAPRFLLTAYAYMLGGYLGLALAAIGIDWTFFSTKPEPGPFIAIPLAAAGIALTVLAWHGLYRHYADTDPAPASVKPAASAKKPVLAVVSGLPATSAR